MPFCPSCHAEYQPDVDFCSDCDTSLEAALPDDPTGEMVNVYVCFDGQNAERALELLLSEGIEPLLRDNASTAFPIDAGTESKKLIAVSHADLVKARELLSAAVADEVLLDTGKVLGD